MFRFLCFLAAGMVLALSCSAAEWFEQNELPDLTLHEWSSTANETRMETLSEIIAGSANPETLKAAGEESLKGAAADIERCMLGFLEQGAFDRNMNIFFAARFCMVENKKNYPFLLSKAEPAKETPAAGPRPVPVDDKKFLTKFGSYAAILEFPRLPAKPAQSKDDERTTIRTYKARGYSVQIHFPDGEKAPSLFLFNGAWDGSQQSAFSMIKTVTSFIASLTQEMDVDSRNALLRQLGIIPFSLADGLPRQWRGKGIKFTASFGQPSGIVVSAEAE